MDTTQTHNSDTSNVIEIASHAAQDAKVLDLGTLRPDYRFPALNQLEAYWHAKRDGRLVPSRSDINPRGIEDTLEFAFISEEIAPGMARFRLAGMHLTDLMGFDVRGMPMSSLFKANARAEFRDALKVAFEGPQIVKIDVVSNGSYGVPALEGRLILLPLTGDDGKVTRLLGGLSTVGPVGRSPRTFEIKRTLRLPLTKEVATATQNLVQKAVPKPQPADQKAVSKPELHSKPAKKDRSFLKLLSFDT